MLESLPPEQRPIAEQVLRGGIPAVRRALEEQNARAKAEGQAEIKADALVQLAEELLPKLKAADWRDRAEAASTSVDEIGLRDLRSVVAGSDVARDDEPLTASTLAPTRAPTTQAACAWTARSPRPSKKTASSVRLQSLARPPDPAFRFPADVAVRLSEAAGQAMAADVAADRWVAVLEAVAASPVRRTVKPAGLPVEPGEALIKLANQLAGQVPALARYSASACLPLGRSAGPDRRMRPADPTASRSHRPSPPGSRPVPVRPSEPAPPAVAVAEDAPVAGVPVPYQGDVETPAGPQTADVETPDGLEHAE